MRSPASTVAPTLHQRFDVEVGGGRAGQAAVTQEVAGVGERAEQAVVDAAEQAGPELARSSAWPMAQAGCPTESPPVYSYSWATARS